MRGSFWEGRGKGDGGELPKSTLACGCSEAANTGLDTELLAMPGSLGEFGWWNPFWVFACVQSESLLMNWGFSEEILMELNGVIEAILASLFKNCYCSSGAEEVEQSWT